VHGSPRKTHGSLSAAGFKKQASRSKTSSFAAECMNPNTMLRVRVSRPPAHPLWEKDCADTPPSPERGHRRLPVLYRIRVCGP
jgi:hypothetical protein